MRVLVWGLGYVGTVSAACLAKLGHEVVGVEPNAIKVAAINAGDSAVKEPGLADLVREMAQAGRLRAVQNGTAEVARADISLICVGTPSSADGSPQLQYIRQVAADIGRGLAEADGYHTVVLRSTVFPGQTRGVLLPLLEEAAGKRAGADFGLAMNPEFLRESSAIADFYAPPYTVIGALDERAGQAVAGLYAEVNAPVRQVALEEAELIKLVNNAFHALKAGFANEVGRLAAGLDIDSHVIMDLVCEDTKLNISPAYLRPGFAFGGSCLPKDLRSLVHHGRRLGVSLPIFEAILPSNQLQIEAARQRIAELGAQRVGVLGLSFKAGTDDLRESPVIDLIRQLWQEGVDVAVYDPDVQPETMLGSNRAYLERQLPQIGQILCADLERVLEGSQLVVVSQRRPEFLAAVQRLNGRAAVLDLVRLSEARQLPGVTGYTGLSW